MVTRSTFGLDGQRAQQFLQHARRGRLADRDRAGDADDEGRLAASSALRKRLPLAKQQLARLDMRRQQPRQRQVDAPDLVEIDRIVERAQPLDLVGRQRQRRVGAELAPSARPRRSGRASISRSGQAGPSRPRCRRPAQPGPRDAFSAMPDCAGAALEFGQHVGQRHAGDRQHDQQMIEQVGAFGDERLRGRRRRRRSPSRPLPRRASWPPSRCRRQRASRSRMRRSPERPRSATIFSRSESENPLIARRLGRMPAT